jgi:glycosyltransferase involved in cell wall biosynthesis
MSKHEVLPEVALVIPAYNEGSRLGGDPFRAALDSNMSAFSKEYPRSELFVVDDGSIDNTTDIALEHGYKVVRHDVNRGKGAAIRTGVSSIISTGFDTQKLTIAFTDADGSYTPETNLGLVALAQGRADIAIAKRIEIISRKKTLRDIAHPAVKFLMNTLANTGVSDPQAGSMAFSGAAIDVWTETTIDGFGATSQALHNAFKAGLKVTELEAEVTDFGESRVRPIDGLKIVMDAFRIRLGK